MLEMATHFSLSVCMSLKMGASLPEINREVSLTLKVRE